MLLDIYGEQVPGTDKVCMPISMCNQQVKGVISDDSVNFIGCWTAVAVVNAVKYFSLLAVTVNYFI